MRTRFLVGTGTLVEREGTGNSPNTGTPNYRGTAIEGGVSRRVVPGDVVIIPGRTPHWWSSLDGDIRYLIIRLDPEGLQTPLVKRAVCSFKGSLGLTP